MVKISLFFLVFVLIAAWLFSGWPQIWQNPSVPSEVKTVKANPDTEIKKPTTSTLDSGAAFTNPENAYDLPDTGGDESTNAYQYNAVTGIYRWHTWAAKGQTYTATVLKIKWDTSGGFSDDHFAIEATKDGGTWNLVLVADGVHNETTIQTAQVSLDTDQDLTQVQVRVNHVKVGGGDKDYIYIYDIWTEGTYTPLATTFLIGGTETGTKDTAVTTITFPVGAPSATVSDPYNDVDGSGDPQVLHATVSEPVVKIKNTHGSQAYNVVLEITTWTNNVVNMEYYNLATDGATNIETVTAELSNANGAARTVSTGVSIAAGTYKDLYLKLVLGSVAGKTGTSTLTILGEVP